jgi:hypothetical protein
MGSHTHIHFSVGSTFSLKPPFQKLLNLKALVFAHKLCAQQLYYEHSNQTACVNVPKSLPLKIFFSRTESGKEKLNRVLES